jgi:hypothetical protein
MLLRVCQFVKNRTSIKRLVITNKLYSIIIKHKLPLNEVNKAKELNTIINIAENNGYNRQQILRMDNLVKWKRHHINSKVKQKWVSLMFSGSYI